MSSIQVADQTFVAAAPEKVAARVSVPARWRAWWPDLVLDVREDRGEKGVRWTVAGPLTGTMEVWLEQVMDGTIVHYFLHAEPTGVSSPGLASLDLAGMNHARRLAGKTMAFEIKKQLEAGRAAGEPPV
ncbi:polyketide cyclase / dehydrase and lipid transport [Rhodococcus sp. ABRD24]|uniref:polyketide cyclase / dehydrase and lipid transport n=1 Tax=Rhodococcus sp. ABRD24 TaxID=2507582 RepID=UPI00104024C4|nr:polyketide cyclase / dehydrase and lipid transport [Rhodococcus sp. ABRD24]QBJ94896.1 polyketide cyclase / dehydrase and lipid transport [Rhodococcus sp. ABRD24]